jgi:hypothetical protein
MKTLNKKIIKKVARLYLASLINKHPFYLPGESEMNDAVQKELENIAKINSEPVFHLPIEMLEYARKEVLKAKYEPLKLTGSLFDQTTTKEETKLVEKKDQQK